MELNIEEARAYISAKFKNQGDFDFISDSDFGKMLDTLLSLDDAYMRELGEDDPYDEDVVFERMHAALLKQQPNLKTYLMRFVDDYMDFMEQYLVSIDAVEWE